MCNFHIQIFCHRIHFMSQSFIFISLHWDNLQKPLVFFFQRGRCVLAFVIVGWSWRTIWKVGQIVFWIYCCFFDCWCRFEICLRIELMTVLIGGHFVYLLLLFNGVTAYFIMGLWVNASKYKNDSWPVQSLGITMTKNRMRIWIIFEFGQESSSIILSNFIRVCQHARYVFGFEVKLVEIDMNCSSETLLLNVVNRLEPKIIKE